MSTARKTTGLTVALLLLGALIWAIVARLGDDEKKAGKRTASVPTVEVAPAAREAIALRRSYSGTLEASASHVVAAKIAGRVARLAVDLGDPVRRGQTVAWLDDDELVQAAAAADAQVAVAVARRREADSALAIAQREFDRTEKLHERGVAPSAELDAEMARRQAAEAALAVAKANVQRARAELQGAKVRQGYAEVVADWQDGGSDTRVVARRHVDAGDMADARAPIFTLVALSPLRGVVDVTEADYRFLREGQRATLQTDARPGETFPATVARIAPVFRETSRQARVELEVPNAEGLLKPGMFVRATLELDRAEGALVVPEAAVTRREDAEGVFVVQDDQTVRWQPVQLGFRDRGRVQVKGVESLGRVVVLGHQLVGDGSKVKVAEPPPR